MSLVNLPMLWKSRSELVQSTFKTLIILLLCCSIMIVFWVSWLIMKLLFIVCCVHCIKYRENSTYTVQGGEVGSQWGPNSKFFPRPLWHGVKSQRMNPWTSLNSLWCQVQSAFKWSLRLGLDVCGQTGVCLSHSGHMVERFVERKLSLSTQVVFRKALESCRTGVTSIPKEQPLADRLLCNGYMK